MKDKLSKLIIELINSKYGINLESIQLREPPKKELGDFAFNCGILSKELKKSPIIIAGEIINIINDIDIVEFAKIDGSYINIKLLDNIFTDLFNKLYLEKDSLVGIQKNNKTNIVIDFIGANVGKPLHIGHMCTPNQGQVLINLYKKLGYNVISDSHIGDWGIIFGKLILAFKLWGSIDKLEENSIEYLLELYIKISKESKDNDSLEQDIRNEFKLLSEGNSESVELWKKFTTYSIDATKEQLYRLNIEYDYDIGESFYEGLGLPKIQDFPDLKWNMNSIVEELLEKGIATKNEDNSVGVVFSDESKLSSCILQKRDGTHGYLASDLAAIKYRVNNWNPEQIIYFTDSRQQLHFKQAFYIASSAGWLKNTELFHAFNGFISLKDGAMSTRDGTIIKLDKLLDEAETRAEKIILEKRDDINGNELRELSKTIGIGAIKYGYLKKSREIDVIFDWDEFMSFEGNSGPYIQYAYVRSIRILEKSDFSNLSKEVKFGNLEYSEEIELVKQIGNYNNILSDVIKTNSPHILCKYSYDLTKAFNSFYNNVHIISEDDDSKKIMRLKLVELFGLVLKDSFNVLGIDMPDKM